MSSNRPNILLVVLDSVRASNTSIQDHVNETTPFLEQFSETATNYTQARSPGAWSLPSHVSMFTGLDVMEHQIHSPDQKLDHTETIFSELSTEGFNTGVFSANPWLAELDSGLKDAFDVVVGPPNELPFPEALDAQDAVLESDNSHLSFLKKAVSSPNTVKSIINGGVAKAKWDHPELLPDSLDPDVGCQYHTDEFLNWSADADGPWAACINYMDAHHPYTPKEEYNQWGDEELLSVQSDYGSLWEALSRTTNPWKRSALESLYDGAIRELDEEIKRLVSSLDERGELDDTLIIITSDHGETFGEGSRVSPGKLNFGHGYGIHEANLHVPLVVKSPHQDTSEKVSTPVSLTQIPDAIRATVDGGTPDFRRDNPVIASVLGMPSLAKERGRGYFDNNSDFEQFDAGGHAVYTTLSGGIVEKTMSWGDESSSTHFTTDSHRTDGGKLDAVRDIDTVAISGRSVEQLDSDTETRLEELGYL